MDFDYGVSIDHLIVTATEAEKNERYELTIHNADEFLKEHRAQGLDWTPIGAVQGWDPKSYADAAQKYVAMGYDYIALGGLVRTSTPKIMELLELVHKVVPSSVAIHLFGLARAAFPCTAFRPASSGRPIRLRVFLRAYCLDADHKSPTDFRAWRLFRRCMM